MTVATADEGPVPPSIEVSQTGSAPCVGSIRTEEWRRRRPTLFGCGAGGQTVSRPFAPGWWTDYVFRYGPEQLFSRPHLIGASSSHRRGSLLPSPSGLTVQRSGELDSQTLVHSSRVSWTASSYLAAVRCIGSSSEKPSPSLLRTFPLRRVPAAVVLGHLSPKFGPSLLEALPIRH